jgi:hypothetical protein
MLMKLVSEYMTCLASEIPMCLFHIFNLAMSSNLNQKLSTTWQRLKLSLLLCGPHPITMWYDAHLMLSPAVGN